MLTYFAIDGASGVSDNGDGTYRVDLADGSSRLATDAEIRAAATLDVSERIKAERDRRRPLGVTVGAVKFHSDDTSRIQQLGLLMMGASMPTGLKWKVIGGAMVDMTPTLAQQVFAATAARDQALFAAAEAHIAAATASDDPAAYDYSAGWPE